MLLQKINRFIRTINYPSYFVFFVTKKCNANCKMCFYKDNMNKENGKELTIYEYDMISKQIKTLNILGISGGEPFLRKDLSEILYIFYKNCKPLVIDLPTNGFFTDIIIKQTEQILTVAKDTTIDIQLSLDGPESIHDEIRGIKGSFNKVKETYNRLLVLRKKYKNLRIKICTVYSHYNQNYIFELSDIINKYFNNIDRFVFSVVHGSAHNLKSFDINWEIYFWLCSHLDKHIIVHNKRDFHSLFTRALRKHKNNVLRDVIDKNNMYKKCNAGKRVIVINEIGDVMPCEPLWYKIGNLRENGYCINSILNSDAMNTFLKNRNSDSCKSCNWGLPMSNNLLYSPKHYASIIKEMVKGYRYAD